MRLSNPGAGSDAAEPTNSAVAHIPPRIIRAEWRATPVKCGDQAGMSATTQNIPAGTTATFTVKRVSDSGTITTASSDSRAASIEGGWVSQKSSETRNGVEAKFTVAAAGVQADSEEDHLSFHLYPDIARRTRTHDRPTVGVAPLAGRYTIEFTDGQMVIKVRVKLLNKQGARPPNAADYAAVAVGPPVSGVQKSKMKSRIEKVLSRRLDLHRKQCARGDGCNCPRGFRCCRFEVVVQVFFVESDEHHVVNLWPGSARHNVSNWHVVESRPELSWAHETGHLLGWYDEHAGGGTCPPAENPHGRWRNDRPAGIMGQGSGIVWDHLEDFRSWFNNATGEDWRLIG